MLEFSIDATQVPVGGCFVLHAKNLPEGADVTATTDTGFTPVFYDYEGEQIALMPARYLLDPGVYHITLSCSGVSQTFTVTFTDAGFEVEVFEVEQSVADATVNNSRANQEFDEITTPLKQSGDPEKYWEGAFQLPVKQETLKISSSFGYTRIINGVAERHGGVDFPAPADTPVTAANNGRVLFAGYLQLTGNTVCIEHGFGLKSWYYHMNGVNVEAGDRVKTGQQIGRVGSTGFSTGNHLHFAMTVNTAFVNPWQFIENGLLEVPG